MVSTMHSPDPTHQQSLLEAAQQGNSNAIARLLQQALMDYGITVKAHTRQDQLDIALESRLNAMPQAHPEWVITIIQQSLGQLQPQNISTVQITWDASSNSETSEQAISLSPAPLLSPMGIEILSDEDMHTVAKQFAPHDHDVSPQLAVGPYNSQWTSKGLIITPFTPPQAPIWQKRSTVAPHHICPSITRLLNRQTELKATIATLQAGGGVEFVGEAGSGKTALLRAICHHPQMPPRFPGGIVYQKAYEQPVEDLIQTVFEALYRPHQAPSPNVTESDGNRPSHPHYKPTALEIKQHLSPHQLCLVLDELSPAQPSLLEELSLWPNLALLVSSHQNASPKQHTSNLPNGRNIPIKGLPLKDAVVLLEECLKRSLQPNEEKDAERLCAALGGHPRRLMQMAALIRHHHVSLDELVQQLQQGTVPEAIILKSVSSLPESDRRVIAILAAFAGTPIHELHISPLVDLDSVTDQLTNLVDRGLVWTDNNVYRLADNLWNPLQQHWNLTPWLDQSLSYFKTWLRQFTPGHPDPTTLPAYAGATATPVLQNSEALWHLLSHAVRHQKWPDVLALGELMAPGLWLGKRWGRWQQVLLAQWHAARSLHNKPAEVSILHQLGSRALCLGDGLTAHICLARAFHERLHLGDIEGATLTQHNLSILTRSALWTEAIAETTEATLLSAASSPAPMPDPVEAFASPLSNLKSDPILSAELNSQPENQPPPEQPQPPENPEDPRTTAAPPSSPEASEEAVLIMSPNWMAWLWILLGTGGAIIIGLLVFFLGKEPPSNISKLRSKHSFPPQRMGVISEPHKFTITNTSESDITIDVSFEDGDRADFNINDDGCTQQPLEPEETCAIAATFKPSQSGPRSASFLVQVGQNNTPKPLTLQGIGAQVEATLKPVEIAFERQTVTERSTPQTITFKNQGSVAFLVQSSRLLNNDENAFFLQGDTCSGQVLQPRDSCTLKASFLPTGIDNYRAVIEIVDDTGAEIWRIPLTGEGVQPAPAPTQAISTTPRRAPRTTPPPAITPPVPTNPDSANPPATYSFTARPDIIEFDQQEIQTPSIRNIRIVNDGNQSLELTEATIADATIFSITDNSCIGRSILPSQACNITITFEPPAPQLYSSRLTITSDQAGSNTIDMSGSGISALDSPNTAPSNPPDNTQSTPLSINRFVSNPPTIAKPNDSIELCYDISGADNAYIINGSTAETITIPSSTADCIRQTPSTTTTYTLVATQEQAAPIEQSVTISVPEPEPPPTPVAIAPTGSGFVYCNRPVILEWQPVTYANSPVSYGINLQRQDVSTTKNENELDTATTWTPIASRTTSQTSMDISDIAQTLHYYRWQVQAVNTTGKASSPSRWNEFGCINP